MSLQAKFLLSTTLALLVALFISEGIRQHHAQAAPGGFCRANLKRLEETALHDLDRLQQSAQRREREPLDYPLA